LKILLEDLHPAIILLEGLAKKKSALLINRNYSKFKVKQQSSHAGATETQ